MTDRSRRTGFLVAVDFDGVLHQKSLEFSDDVTGDPVPGAAAGLRRLAERYDVVIFTARTALDPVRRWMEEHGIGGFVVMHEKPSAEFYIDDHGFRFISWADVERELVPTLVDPRGAMSQILDVHYHVVPDFYRQLVSERRPNAPLDEAERTRLLGGAAGRLIPRLVGSHEHV